MEITSAIVVQRFSDGYRWILTFKSSEHIAGRTIWDKFSIFEVVLAIRRIMTTLVEYTQIELLTLSGPEFRRVSTAPPRLPTEDEIPIIDLASIDKDLEARKTIASKVRAAAENTGFFYIKNHGISEELIQNALSQAQAFFNQPIEKKQLASSKAQKNADGWHGLGSTQINKTETRGKYTFHLPRQDVYPCHIGDN
jgi:hypothetical protein